MTALTLHSNFKHLHGNVLIGGALFAVVHRRLGPGLGSIAVPMSGVVGNLTNAVWHLTVYRSLGASTAVMGALGILVATQLVVNQARRPTAKAVVTWAPLVAGGALLGMFGASPTSHLHAHGFGFVAGVVMRLIAGVIRHRNTPLPLWFHAVLGAVSLLIVVCARVVALMIWPAHPVFRIGW